MMTNDPIDHFYRETIMIRFVRTFLIRQLLIRLMSIR